MQLYIADYLADTQHLTTEENGAYLLILMTMWRAGGSLPHDQKVLSRTARLSGRKWAEAWGHLAPLFIVTGGAVSQKRLAEEYAKALKKSEVRAQSGSRGGTAKALKSKEPDVANAIVLPQHLLQNSELRDQKEEEKRRAPLASKTGELDLGAPIGATASEPLPKKGTRWPADREIPEEWFATAAARRAKAGLPAIDLRAEAENFVSYWPSVPGAKGTKLDWKLTFENSCLRARAPIAPYPRFGVVQGGAAPAVFVQATVSDWVTRLTIYHGLDESCPKGTWPEKWAAPPGEKDCRVPAEAFKIFESRYGRKTAM